MRRVRSGDSDKSWPSGRVSGIRAETHVTVRSRQELARSCVGLIGRFGCATVAIEGREAIEMKADDLFYVPAGPLDTSVG